MMWRRIAPKAVTRFKERGVRPPELDGDEFWSVHSSSCPATTCSIPPTTGSSSTLPMKMCRSSLQYSHTPKYWWAPYLLLRACGPDLFAHTKQRHIFKILGY